MSYIDIIQSDVYLIAVAFFAFGFAACGLSIKSDDDRRVGLALIVIGSILLLCIGIILITREAAVL